MVIRQTKHTVNNDELESILKTGVYIENNTNDLPENFINKYFTNFDIANFILDIHAQLSSLTSLYINKKIDFKNPPPEIILELNTESLDLVFLRRFFYKKKAICVSHDFFAIPLSSRGKGHAKQIFRSSLQQYVNIGVSKIFVHAGLENGGYTWARFGFTADNKAEMDVILRNAKTLLSTFQFDAVLKIYNNYYNRHVKGHAFEIIKWAEMPFMRNVLLDSVWAGTMDLNNSEQFRNFINYIYE